LTDLYKGVILSDDITRYGGDVDSYSVGRRIGNEVPSIMG